MTNYFQAFASRARPPDGDLLKAEVGDEGDRLRAVLAMTDPADLSADQIHAEVAGNLWMLAPEAFRYFLPAFLNLAVARYDVLGIFVAELMGALTEPARGDVTQAFDGAARIPAEMGLTPDTLRQLRQQQLDWYDSGAPLASYQERMAGLSATEAETIVSFLATIRDTHGRDFPFNEPQVAIDRFNACRGTN